MEPLQHGLLQEKDCDPSLIILFSEPETKQQWSSFHFFQSKHPCCMKQYNLSAEIMSQSHCDTSEAFLQNTNQSQNTKRDTFLAPSVTCRAVNRISLTYSNNRFVSGEPILPWHPPSEELYPLCLKVLFRLCEVDDTIAYIMVFARQDIWYKYDVYEPPLPSTNLYLHFFNSAQYFFLLQLYSS